jgi:eukaryotic-like serine/threonine-protein kinase
MTGFSPTRVIGGRYVVLGAIRGAAAGPVWRASDRVTGRQVCVAELRLPTDLAERPRVREQVLRSARAAGRLDHPGIVVVHDVVTDGDADHIVTELVDAPTLAARVAADGPLDERAASAMARQLASALQAAHAAGIVHGDVGPHTVLIAPDGVVRLAGAGITEAVDPQRTTRDPAFLAPELRGGAPATPEADLWALGAVLHVAVLGRPPADGVVPVFGGGALASALAGLLRPEPRDRPTARQVAADLEAARRHADAVPGRGRRWWWAGVGAALGLLAGLVAGLALAGPRIPVVDYGPDADVAGGCLVTAPAPGVVPAAADCAGPHGAEIIASLDPFGAAATRYPGRDSLVRFAAAACEPAFETVVEPAGRSGLRLVALVPTEAAFGAGDRAVHCVVRASDGSALTGTRVAGQSG